MLPPEREIASMTTSTRVATGSSRLRRLLSATAVGAAASIAGQATLAPCNSSPCALQRFSMRTGRRALVVSLAGVFALTVAVPAGAQESETTVTAAVSDLGGGRVISSVPAVVLAKVTDTTMSAAFSAEIVETLALGTSWSVSATMSGLVQGDSTIDNGYLGVSGRGVTQVGGGGTSAAPSGRQDLSEARTLFDVTGQAADTRYSGTYVGTSTVDLDLSEYDGALTDGLYSATLTLTLVQ